MLRNSGFVMTRVQSLLVAGIVNIGILVMAGPASAHHAVQAQFDVNKTFTITGTVSKIEWINPHSYLTLNVKDADGKIQKWAFELAAPAVLRRAVREVEQLFADCDRTRQGVESSRDLH